MGNWYTRPTFKKQSSDCIADDITQEPSGSGVSSTGNDTSSAGDDTTQGLSGSGVSSTDDTSSAGQTFCYCHGPEEGDMITCDNPDCNIEWFHITCLQMKRFPKGKGKWFCPDCGMLPKFQVCKRKV